MKALFLTFHGFHATNGISKKIHYQVRALEANGVETHLCYLSEKQGIKYRMLDQEILADYGDGIKGKLYKRFEFNSVFRYIIKNQIDLVYIRSDQNANPFTIRLVRKNKKSRNPRGYGNSHVSVRSRIRFIQKENTTTY